VIVVLPALMAFVVAWWLTRQLCSPKSFLSILAHPNERTLHATPIPQTGGVAVIVSVVISLILAASVLAIAQPSKPVLPKGLASGSVWIVASMLLIFVVSLIDDCVGLPASLRLGVQAVSALIITVGVGLTLSSIPIPGGPTVLLGIAAIPVSVLVLLWMANLYNFMDGMDGFSGGMTAIGFGFLAYFGWEVGYPIMLLIATIVAMSAVGFLAHNFPPARIFMGDAGSITVGFLAGTLMILGVRDRIFSLWVPIIIFSPFILDATVTLIRRAFHRKRIWEAHREHYYQRLVLSGWSHRRTVLVEYGLMILCGGLAILYHHSTEKWRLVILGTWVVMFLVLERLVKRLEQQTVSRAVRSSKAASSANKVQAVPAEESERVTVKT
jgi:UDP-N-acetylmuramyl pentapeptide phosphotransferase/UDP-N-acetylglucosamine-1-phosphate transferase